MEPPDRPGPGRRPPHRAGRAGRPALSTRCWASRPGAAAAWALPASYAVLAAAGLAWALVIKVRRPDVYDAIGLGAHAASFQTAQASFGARR